ncbi:MAG: poly-gamma-glutamate biosynthesis protein PgsC [Sphaerochaetaceae bacterium]|nr:poly-gamma-glutamate biosynthesis protein PgsC [Sphaerochaetaceae bacterium]
MLHSAVAISILLGFLSTEFLGILSGGLVSAGYLAFYLEQPFRILSTVLLSVATCGLVKLLQRKIILFGRRRFMLTVLLCMVLAFIVEKCFFFFTDINQDMRIIGYIVPGLIANDMEKQGVVKTLLMTLLIAAIIWLIMHSGAI